MNNILYSDGTYSINSFDEEFKLQSKILEKGWYYVDLITEEYTGPFESRDIVVQEYERFNKFLESEPKINKAA